MQPGQPTLDPQLENVLPKEYQLFKRLQKVDHEMEEKIQRKQRELEAQVRAAVKHTPCTLRIRVYHTYTLPSDTRPGEWTLRIEGQIIKGPGSSRRFSSFFRKVMVELDPTLYADQSVIEWTCFRSSDESDGFEISRSGSASHTVHIKLLRRYSPERFQVVEPLLSILRPYLNDRTEETRQQILLAMWKYIKHQDLLKENDCRVILNDAALQQIFQCETMQFHSILERLKPFLQPVQPVSLSYDLKLRDQPRDNQLMDERFFDIEVNAEEDLDVERKAFLSEFERSEDTTCEMKQLEEQEADCLARLNQLVKEREWLVKFSLDPVQFMQHVIQSQQADLKMLAQDHDDPAQVDASFQASWVKDAALLLWHSNME